jgi:hypothetical protein
MILGPTTGRKIPFPGSARALLETAEALFARARRPKHHEPTSHEVGMRDRTEPSVALLSV